VLLIFSVASMAYMRPASIVFLLLAIRVSMGLLPIAAAFYSTFFTAQDVSGPGYRFLLITMVSKREIVRGYYHSILFRLRFLIVGTLGFYAGMLLGLILALFFSPYSHNVLFAQVPCFAGTVLGYLIAGTFIFGFDMLRLSTRIFWGASIGVRHGIEMHQTLTLALFKAGLHTLWHGFGAFLSVFEVMMSGGPFFFFMYWDDKMREIDDMMGRLTRSLPDFSDLDVPASSFVTQ